MEGFKTMGKSHTMGMGIISIAGSLNPNYRLVDFYLGQGGNQVSAFNASCDMKASSLALGFHFSFVISLFGVGEGSHYRWDMCIP